MTIKDWVGIAVTIGGLACAEPVTVKIKVSILDSPFTSTALTLQVNTPAFAGYPLMMPESESKLNPVMPGQE